ncbi:MAG: hypothetical protein LBU62_07970 [Bacteroidales bacterium]|jgi:hypothetical protein|nr:hypothetical protein [Bacteroidales bacterium]
MSINERIRYIIDVLQAGSRKEFATKVGISAAQVYNIIGVNGKIGEKNLSKILLAYPTVSHTWLKSEEGAMLTDGTTPAAPAVTEKVPRAKRTKKAPKDKNVAKKTRKSRKTKAVVDVNSEATVVAPKKRRSKAKAKTELTPKVKRTRSKKETPAAEEQQNQIDLKPKRGRRTRKNKELESVAAAPKKSEIFAELDSKPISAVNALISGQRDLIATNTKLVEANQQLVDLVLKFVKK